MNFKVDASIVCFSMVVLAAIPVAILRSKTYAIGYELGQLKSEERVLTQKKIELQSELAKVERKIRDKYLNKNANNSTSELQLPSEQSVLHKN